MDPANNFGVLLPTRGVLVYPQKDGPRVELNWQMAETAERIGYDSVWVGDSITSKPRLEPLTMMAALAARTHRVKIGTAVMLNALRHPVHLAHALATVDNISDGRVVLGVSLGGREWEYSGAGASITERVARLRENVTTLRRLMTEERVTLDGRFQQLQEVSVNPKPVQPGGVPIIFGGAHENSLRRIAEMADGWVVGGGAKLETFVSGRRRIQEFAAERGRDLSSFEWAKLIYIAVAPDRQQAKAMLEPYIHAYYSPQYDIEGSCALGTPDECVERLRPFAEAGLGTFILGPPSLNVEHLRRIAHEVMPRLS